MSDMPDYVMALGMDILSDGHMKRMSTRKLITFPDDLLERLTEWRRQQPDLPSEAEAIRRLIDLGLKASDKGK